MLFLSESIRRLTSCHLFVLAVLCFAGCRDNAGAEQSESKKTMVRHAAVSGRFYPGSPELLKKTINGYLEKVPDIKVDGEIVAAIAPHAGYVYSGQIAAYTHKLIKNVEFDTVVIIGHDYRKTSDSVAFLSPAEFYETPLGRMPVDTEMVQKLIKYHSGITADKRPHAREHTVEVHLPFFQVLGRKCRIVPVLFGNPVKKNCELFAKAIDACAGDKKVFVLASTDMSHWPPYDVAKNVDLASLEIIPSLDVSKLFAHLSLCDRKGETGELVKFKTSMCARGGLGTAMLFGKAHGAIKAQILKYANSGDVPVGNKDGVVGYASGLIVGK